MKICRLQFKSLALLSVCLCLGLLLFANPAKAAVSFDSYIIYPAGGSGWSNDGTTASISFEVPSDCENAYMVVSGSDYSSHRFSNVKYNGVSFTQYSDVVYNGDSNYAVAYGLADLPVGFHSLSFDHTGGVSDRPIMFDLYCGVNPTDPYDTEYTHYNNASAPTVDIPTDGLLIDLAWGNNNYCDENLSGGIQASEVYQGSEGINQYYISGVSSGNILWENFNGNTTAFWPGYIVLKTTATTPSGYCGDNICNGTETDLTCIDCLTFYDLSSNANAYFKFDNYSNYCPINTTCKINWTFDTSIFNNQDVGHFYWYENSTSTPIDLGYKMLNTSIDLGVYNKGYYATSSAATSTSYSFLAVVPYSSKINTAIATSTTGIWFTEPKNWEQIKTDYYASTSEWADIANMSIDFHTMACTNEEWTEAATSTSWFNFTKLKCNSFYSLLLIGNTVSKIPATVANSFSYLFKTAFPFNIGVKIKQSWDNSASSTLPAGMSFVTDRIDSNGNIYLTSPNIPGIATTTNVIFGPAMGGTGNTEWPTFYEFIRFATTYIFWGLFIYYGIIIRGIRIYQKLKEEV